jgi:murein L,D-transpeptidase YafK
MYKVLNMARHPRFGTVCLMLCLLPFQLGWANDKAPTPTKADRIVIIKSSRTMMLMNGDKVLKTYKVALGGQPVGAKDRQGDHKTPEGNYVVDARVPNSQFHRALHISYPNVRDRERAHKLGVSAGGAVEIHGLAEKFAWAGSAHRLADWTDGCIAVTDEEIDEIWPLVAVGTPVEIRP